MSDNQFAGISFGYNANQIYKYRNSNRCNLKGNVFSYRTPNVFAKTTTNQNKMKVQINMLHKMSSLHSHIMWWAANPPTYSVSFTGSGMPFPNENIAFERTPNQGFIPLQSPLFSVSLIKPNSYYTHLGKKYVPPQLKYCLCDSSGKNCSPTYTVKLSEGIPFRYQTFPPQRNWNAGPMFYCNPNTIVGNQEQILRINGYPEDGIQPPNFWGTISPN